MTEKATFGAGCFWGVEVDFPQRSRASRTPRSATWAATSARPPTSRSAPTHRARRGRPGRVRPGRVSYETLLRTFWNAHNPTQLNPKGRRGTPVPLGRLLPLGPERREQALASKAPVPDGRCDGGRAGEGVPRAEEYHQQYLEGGGGTDRHGPDGDRSGSLAVAWAVFARRWRRGLRGRPELQTTAEIWEEVGLTRTEIGGIVRDGVDRGARCPCRGAARWEPPRGTDPAASRRLWREE